MTQITKSQIRSIRLQAMDAAAEELARDGALVPHEIADTLGDDDWAWVRDRLDLAVEETEDGVELTPDGLTVRS